MRTQITKRTETVSKHFDFDAIDPRGRKIGAFVITNETTFEDSPPEHTWGYTMDPGQYFTLTFHTTRDGAAYGPIQPMQHFKTVEERDQAVAKYLKAAQKRANKLGGK